MEISAQSIPYSPSRWNDIGAKLYAIERQVFGDKAFDEAYLRHDIRNPEVVLVVLKDGENINGFTYAEPESPGVARIADTAIIEAYQHRGLVGLMTERLEDELRERGFEYITEDAMVDNGYADAIERHYGSRILEKRDFVGEYGRQRHFKISI